MGGDKTRSKRHLSSAKKKKNFSSSNIIMKDAIPGYIKQLFWDAKKDEVDLHRHSRYIIRRVLNFGDARAVNWLRRVYPDSLIRDVVKNKRGLEKKTFIYWHTYYEQME